MCVCARRIPSTHPQCNGISVAWRTEKFSGITLCAESSQRSTCLRFFSIAITRRLAHSIKMVIEFKQLPYPLEALEPHISSEQLRYHWDKHLRGYVSKVNGRFLKVMHIYLVRRRVGQNEESNGMRTLTLSLASKVLWL